MPMARGLTRQACAPAARQAETADASGCQHELNSLRAMTDLLVRNNAEKGVAAHLKLLWHLCTVAPGSQVREG